MKKFSTVFIVVSALLFSAYSAHAAGPYIWVANSASSTVSKVDTASDSVTATIQVDEFPYSVAVAQDYVYVSNVNSKTISKINPVTDQVDATIYLDKYPVGLALGADGHIYSVVKDSIVARYYNMAYLYRIDQQTNQITASLPLRSVSTLRTGLGVNQDNLAYIPYEHSWIGQTGIMIVDLDSFRVQGDYKHTPWNSNGLGYCGIGVAIDDEGNGWTEAMRVGQQRSIIKITPSGERTFYKSNGNRSELVIGDDGYLWTTNLNDSGGSDIVRFDMADASYDRYPAAIGSWFNGSGLTYLNGYVWATDPATDKLLKVDPVDGSEVAQIVVGKRPFSPGDMSGYEAARLGFITLVPPDLDDDGVPDDQDLCPDTASGAIIDANGCSGAQLIDLACPCDDTWRNHGQYVSCVAQETKTQIKAGLITPAEKYAFVTAAARSTCGKR
jgi:YVTN family beta-propeller protein